MDKKFISYNAQFIDEEDITAVSDALRSPYLTTGPQSDEFEKRLADYLGVKYAVSMSNGTAALMNALSIKIKKNDFVALPALTFGACGNAILALGGSPVFIDSEPYNWMMSYEDLKKKYKKYKFKILINVHLNGYSTEIIKIRKFCKIHQIFLIEDCAEALGSFYNKKHGVN